MADALPEKMILTLQNVSLKLPDFKLELSLEVGSGVTVLFGPSGAGKTTLFDIIAGLRKVDSARITFGEEVLTDTEMGIHVKPRHRRIGYVPQDLALFPHLSVRQNLLYGFRASRDERFSVEHIVDLLELQALIERGVTPLSGGEKRRVALARALLTAPRLLLLDEPLANLDLPLKRKILPYLSRIRDELRLPIFYITHDLFETQSLGDELIVIARGRILQRGPAPEVLRQPANAQVAGLLSAEGVSQ
jgi:molybdate transport system ATP-binding protein